MKKWNLLCCCGVSSLLLLAGCSTTTTIYDPDSVQTDVRGDKTVSSEEIRQAAVAAIHNAMTSPRFSAFLVQYRKEMKDPNALPLLKLDKALNETDDPDLNMGELTDAINEALLNAGKVDVTMAEGAGLSKSIGKSRDLEYDENFDRKTVAKRGTLQAARLVMRPKVISNTVNDGKKKAVVRTFVLEMADIHTGRIIWKYSKRLGFTRTKGTFGW